MKSWWGIASFVFVGFFLAIIISFPNVFSQSPLPYDYEQQGLNRQIVIKFAYVVAQNTPKGLAAQKFAALVSQKTHGRVKVELFPDGTLYNEFDEINALEKGNIQMTAPSLSIVAEQIPQWSLMDLPFAFTNEAAVNAAFEGDIGKQLLATLPGKNMVGLALWKNGFRQITNDKRPIVYPSDMTGLNFRTETSKVSEAEFQLFGAYATPLPFNQLYNKLESHSSDGEENSISNIYTQRLYEVQKYMTINQISYLGYVVLVNKPFWDSLPLNLRQEIQQAMNETTTWERQKAEQLNRRQLKQLQSQTKMKITRLTPAQKSIWIRKMKPIYHQFANMFGPRLIDDIQIIQKQYGK